MVVQEASASDKSATEPVARATALIERMSLAEKIGQMTQVDQRAITPEEVTHFRIGSVLSGGGSNPSPNTPQAWADMVYRLQQAALKTPLGIPLVYGVDAVHGHSNVVGATIFPHNIGLGAARDPQLVERVGRATAAEASATGVLWNFAPCIAVPQDLRWGRTYEGFSENPELVAELGAAYVRGLQGVLGSQGTILACPKHFVADGGTSWGTTRLYKWLDGDWQAPDQRYEIDQGDAQMDEATLRQTHLRPYVAAIEAGALSIMVSFSSWNGVKMHGHRYLLTDVLKGELGFDGFLVSDWHAIDQLSADPYECVVRSINAGLDMIMIPFNYRRFISLAEQAVEAGDIPMSRIDDAVKRILKAKFELGLFERQAALELRPEILGKDEHRELAREAVRKSLVLLKNEDGALPIPKHAKEILVAGEAADDIGLQCGGWTIEWQGRQGDITIGTTILEAIQATVSANTTLDYDRFGHFEGTADVCIAVVGEEPYAEGLGDSDSLSLPITDQRMLGRLSDKCDRLVTVLISGRPMIVADYLNDWDAFVAVWLPGTEGQGVADALFGDVPSRGRLPYTWPRSVDQLPLSALASSGEVPLFSFGYGLEN